MKRAFYDFTVSPYSFDFAVFLLAARAAECDEVVIVPGQRLVVGPDGAIQEFQKCTPGAQEYRLNNLLLGLCPKAIVCQTRGEAKAMWHEGCFPEGYTVDKPVQAHTISAVLKSLKIMPFTPSEEKTAEVIADGWTDEKLVAITIRYSNIKSGRNSSLDDWVKAADWMRTKGMYPVFIPDTDQPWMKFIGADGYEHKSCPKAAVFVLLALVSWCYGGGFSLFSTMRGFFCEFSSTSSYGDVPLTRARWCAESVAPGRGVCPSCYLGLGVFVTEYALSDTPLITPLFFLHPVLYFPLSPACVV